MSLLICPQCKTQNFLWYLDEEVSPLTQWVCQNCNYTCTENEHEEKNCPDCHKKSYSLLKDDEKTYRWCSSCHSVE